MLNEIIINDKKIKFNYQKLEEINSYRSKQLVSIDVYNTPSNILKKYNFNYDAFTLPATYSMWMNSYTNADEKRIFLKNVQEVIPSTNEQTTRYAFDYYSPELIPPRHSFAKDIWGYFNGAHNLNIVYNNLVNNSTPNYTDGLYNAFNNVHSERFPNSTYTLNGMLKNIYYPTKGKTEFIYEANSVSKDKLITPGNVGVASFAVSETVGYNSIHYSHSFTVQQNATVTFSLVAWRDCGIDDPVHPPQALADIINADTGATVKSLFANETPAQTTASLVTGVNYKIKFKISRPCLGANANIVGPATPPYTIKINDPVGGVRVSKTLDYDNNGNVEIKKYFYGTLNKPDISSGILSTINPNYQSNIDLFRKTVTGPGGGTNDHITYTMFSNVKTSLFSLDGYSIMYPSVIESFGENFEKGGILHLFYANQDETPIPICEDLIRGVAFSNSFLTGNKYASYNFKKNGNNFITVSSEEYNYTHNELFDKSVDNYIARLKIIQNTGFYLSFYGVNKYQLRSQFHYLSSKKNTIYDKNGQNPVKTETEYFYNNPLHYQLSKTLITEPDLRIEEKSFQYAHEKGNTKLINANMIGIPLETTVVKKQNSTDVGKVISKLETKYDEPTHLFPTSVLSQNLQTNVMSTELTYDQYDSSGNLLQYTTKDGIVTSIIWGYNGTQPIAKIVGLAYNFVSGLATDIITASNNDASNPSTENALISTLESFRNLQQLKETQISTYTYDPLIGVTSITPPSGIREIYKYDSANRLENIKDINGKLLKEFKYNYKH